MDCVPLDQLEQEIHRELASEVLASRFAVWSQSDPTLRRFRSAGDMMRFLRSRPSSVEEDAVLRPLVAQAMRDPLAGQLVLFAVLPGLKNLARRSLVSVEEREELWSALLACVWEQIRSYPLERRPRRIAANLLLDTLRHTLRAMRASRTSEQPLAREPREDDPDPLAFVSPTDGDVDALLERAVAQGAISEAERDLVLATRFDGVALADVAAAKGEPYNRVKVRRQRAERRLLVWLGYRPVPRRAQKRPPLGARVVGAGPSGQAGECPPIP